MLAAMFLLLFFIGAAMCEDDETMALVCNAFETITLTND